MHPQKELGLAVDAFTDINDAYDEYQAKERLTKEDITAINKIISELDSMYIADGNDQSLSYQLANHLPF